MIPTPSHSKAIRISLVFLVISSILYIEIAFQANLAQAGDHEQLQNMAVTPTKTKKSDKPTKTPLGGKTWFLYTTPESHILCGELVYITSYSKIKQITPSIKPTVATIGLRPCNSEEILIFKTHPRDLIQFYQFRDPKFATGSEICTAQYGCLHLYITTFKNYIGLESCSACGISMLPPTWTQIPLTPYTSTPVPPTRTPWPTPVSPTPSPTLAPEEITPTLNLFELLHGTETPASGLASQTEQISTETPTAQAATSTPTVMSTSSEPLYRRISPAALLLLALLAFLIPLVILLRDYLRDR